MLLRHLVTLATGVLNRTPVALDNGAECDPLDCALLPLGKKDAFTTRDACEGVMIFGAVGSGKTSGSGAAFARAFLSAGFGGLVLAAKVDEVDLWRHYAEEADRSDDLIVVAPGNRHRFNFLSYEWKRQGAGAAQLENIVQSLMVAAEVAGERQDGTSDPYWSRASRQLLRSAAHLVALATGGMRLADILAVIRWAPRTPEDLHDEGWRSTSICFAMLLAASEKLKADPDPAARADYDITEAYWLREFPALAEKTRSIIVQNFTSLIDPFTRSPFRELFCGETTFTPEDALNGKVIVLDLAVKEWGDVGRIAQVLFKTCFQKTVERRDVRKSPVPVFLFADEAQLFLSSSDEAFLQTARSSRACTVFLTQNLPNVFSALGGGPKAQHQGDSILGNLSTQIFHTNGDANTNEYAAKRIGQTWQMRQGTSHGYSANTSQSGGTPENTVTSSIQYSDNTGSNLSEQLAFQILPQEFTTLRQGGSSNNFEVDAIVFKPGRVWQGSGTNFMRITFRQRIA